MEMCFRRREAKMIVVMEGEKRRGCWVEIEQKRDHVCVCKRDREAPAPSCAAEGEETLQR